MQIILARSHDVTSKISEHSDRSRPKLSQVIISDVALGPMLLYVLCVTRDSTKTANQMVDTQNTLYDSDRLLLLETAYLTQTSSFSWGPFWHPASTLLAQISRCCCSWDPKPAYLTQIRSFFVVGEQQKGALWHPPQHTVRPRYCPKTPAPRQEHPIFAVLIFVVKKPSLTRIGSCFALGPRKHPI